MPEELTTYSVPVGFNVFLPNGLFAGLTTTFVHQKVERSSGNVLDIGEGDDSFALVDFQVGYRLPERFGVLSLAVNNLFDQSFKYQDNSFREFNDSVSVSPYVPERQVMARLTLNW
ncbi:MAG: TonB-dependent receptor [Geminicoccaceae bacterium]